MITNGGFENNLTGWQKYQNAEVSHVHSGKKALYINSSRSPYPNIDYVYQCQSAIPPEATLQFWMYPEVLTDKDPQFIDMRRNWSWSGYGDFITVIYVYKSKIGVRPWCPGYGPITYFNYSLELKRWHQVRLFLDPGIMSQWLYIDGSLIGRANGTTSYAPEWLFFGDLSLAEAAGCAYYDDISLTNGGKNYVLNGDFEGPSWDPWLPNPGFPVYNRNSTVNSGMKSLYVGDEISSGSYVSQLLSTFSATNYTMTSWVHPLSLTPASPQIMALVANWNPSARTGDYATGVEIYSGDINLKAWVPSGGGGAEKSVSMALSKDKWHNITVMADSIAKKQFLFVDSLPVANVTLTTGTVFTPDEVLLGDLTSSGDAGKAFWDDVSLKECVLAPEGTAAGLIVLFTGLLVIAAIWTTGRKTTN
jgi:hypothetical protein